MTTTILIANVTLTAWSKTLPGDLTIHLLGPVGMRAEYTHRAVRDFRWWSEGDIGFIHRHIKQSTAEELDEIIRQHPVLGKIHEDLLTSVELKQPK